MDLLLPITNRQIMAENIKEWMGINKKRKKKGEKRESILRFGLAHAHTAG